MEKPPLILLYYRKSIERSITKSSAGSFGGNYFTLVYFLSRQFWRGLFVFIFLGRCPSLTYIFLLQKFRAGGFNVIVATSIGEEGLDIMEVDLVICFDANVSPLRMIQRMGRTGRKHDGRVDILLAFNCVWIRLSVLLMSVSHHLFAISIFIFIGFEIMIISQFLF